MTHELKIAPKFLDDILYHGKNFEIRKNDRNFKCGDTLVLKSWTKENGYSGEIILCFVGYILKHDDFPDGIAKDYVVLGLRNINKYFDRWLAEHNE